ncbi:MAG: hypothetical protein ACOYNL_08255 [Rickettsiales bacterium]
MVGELNITGKDIADQLVDGTKNAAVGMLNQIPLLGHLKPGDYIAKTPLIQQITTESHAAITREGNDSSSWFGQLIRWVSGLLKDIQSWFKKTVDGIFGTPVETPPATQQGTQPGTASAVEPTRTPSAHAAARNAAGQTSSLPVANASSVAPPDASLPNKTTVPSASAAK